MTTTRYQDVQSYITLDGSEIRELMHPHHQPVQNQSLAEARIAPGVTTHRHRHHRSEELYHILQGEGVMNLDDEWQPVGAGDTVLIPPGTPHCLRNSGDEPLVMLCCCSPAYDHQDTELL